ncbi:hypothetical protein ACQCVK_17565, partial [Rossellomorea vietnamensis]|uniref:hypothetical protein n=1 Tax=Rossellomorea vietnamensis TaxID=218284 RepID=UPI003CF2D902
SYISQCKWISRDRSAPSFIHISAEINLSRPKCPQHYTYLNGKRSLVTEVPATSYISQCKWISRDRSAPSFIHISAEINLSRPKCPQHYTYLNGNRSLETEATSTSYLSNRNVSLKTEDILLPLG